MDTSVVRYRQPQTLCQADEGKPKRQECSVAKNHILLDFREQGIVCPMTPHAGCCAERGNATAASGLGFSSPTTGRYAKAGLYFELRDQYDDFCVTRACNSDSPEHPYWQR